MKSYQEKKELKSKEILKQRSEIYKIKSNIKKKKKKVKKEIGLERQT